MIPYAWHLEVSWKNEIYKSNHIITNTDNLLMNGIWVAFLSKVHIISQLYRIEVERQSCVYVMEMSVISGQF